MAALTTRRIQVKLNGQPYELNVDPEMPLLYVLRDELGLHAAKYGCGLGRCGTCTVHIDGQAALSCMVTVGEVGEQNVTTLEGLAPGDALHPLQQAILDEQAAQCGYCIPGIVMTTAALLVDATRTVAATYSFPVQAHASLGPSCAVADVQPDHATIYTSSQGVYGLRQALAPVLGLPEEQVRLIYREGAGCYGHNGADDVAADAAVLSQLAGRPVRVQWMRRDEFAWEPKSPAMLIDMTAALGDGGEIAAWQHTAWTATHTARPSGQPGNLLVAHELDPRIDAPPRFGGGDRNAATTYSLPNERVTMHWLPDVALHSSAMRSLGGLHNTTANECFFDEIAHQFGADPVALRLRYLDDPRAVAVVEAAQEKVGWDTPLVAPEGLLAGRGFAYAQYEGEYAYVAMVAEVLIDPATGEIRISRIVVAHDCGQIINPDGVRNQIEGNIIQVISRSLHEAVRWDDEAVTTLTWETYRILTFPEVPQIEIVLIDRPGEPPWGAGEPAICPVTAAIGNAIFAATGVRLRNVPFTIDPLPPDPSPGRTGSL